MRLTIAAKLGLISAVFITVTAASIITAFYIGGSRSLLSNSLKQYSTLAQQEGQRLNAALADSVNDLQFVTQLHSLSAYAEQLGGGRSDNPDALDELAQRVGHEFRNLLSHHRDYRQFRFIDTAGQERIRVDQQGQIISSIKGRDLQDKSASRYVVETLKLPAGAIYFSDINLNREHGKVVEPLVPTLRIATPIADSSKQTVGILVLNLDIGPQLGNVRSALGDLSKYAYITNASGSYLSHHDPDMTFGFETDSDHRVQDMLPEIAVFYDQAQQQQFVMLPVENRASLAAAFRKIQYDTTNPEHFITVGIAAPKDVILQDEMALIQRNIYWALVLTFTGIIAALFFSVRLSRPLNEISRAAQQFITQRERFTSQPDGNDEIAQLGRVIKKLTDEVLDNEKRLQSLNSTLEQRIETRSRELITSQKMLETILDALPNRIFWKDMKGKYMGCNQHFADDAGLSTPHQIMGKSDHDMPWAEYAADYQADDRQVIESGEAKLNIIEPISLSDDSIKWLETHKLPLLGADSGVIGVLGSYQDITHRRNAENSLRNSEERLRKSQHIAHVGTWDWNISEDTLLWSDEIYTIFGLEPQQLRATYEAFLEYIHPDDVDLVNSTINHSINNKEFPYYVNHRVVRPGGEIRYVEEHGEVERDNNGLPTRMIGVVHDITDNILVQLELHREKERAERYLYVSEAIILELDTQGTINRINQRGCELLEYRMNELHGRNWFDTVIPPDLRDAVKEVFAELMAQPKPDKIGASSSYYENDLLTSSGALITITWHNTVNYDDTGHATGTLSSGQDITQRKHMERLKDEFISIISHELRTPLTSIHGSLRLILGHVFGELPQKVLELVQLANNNSERLLALINDLLDVQKIEAGMMQFNFAVTSPEELLRDAVQNNTPFATQHEITLNLRCNSDKLPKELYADYDRLIQVMNNLLSNAIKFSPKGSEVEVVLSGNTQQLEIAVNDRGTGIPEHHRERLFDKFTQVDSSDARKQGGTGLGLNIARLIVDKHHGSISYHNNPGGGSSFRVTLPVDSAPDEGGSNN